MCFVVKDSGKAESGNNKLKLTHKQIAESALFLAIALALSQIKAFQMPQGGSVSLIPIPVIILAARHGFKLGLLSSLILGGILMMISTHRLVNVPQFLLDYPVAYMFLALAGLPEFTSAKKASVITIATCLLRLIPHTAAGMLILYTSSWTAAFWGSFAYNLSHVLPESIVCGIIIYFLYKTDENLLKRQKAA